MTAKKITAFFLIFFSSSAAFCQTNFSSKKNNPIFALSEPAQKIDVGEKLVYEVFWMGIPVGLGEVWIKEKVKLFGLETLHVVATARTNEVLSKIYPVLDEIHCLLDFSSLESVRFEKKVSEGFYRAHEVVIYDREKRKGYYESLKNGSKKEFEISTPVYDVVSAFYWLRRQKMSLRQNLSTIINNGEKDYALKIDVLKHEAKEIRGLGVVDVILIEPKTKFEGVMDKRGKVQVHIQNKPSRIPILITFKTPFGPVVGALQPEQSSGINF